VVDCHRQPKPNYKKPERNWETGASKGKKNYLLQCSIHKQAQKHKKPDHFQIVTPAFRGRKEYEYEQASDDSARVWASR